MVLMDGNDETARVHRVRCGVAIEASLRQVVASIVTEPQVRDAESHGGGRPACVFQFRYSCMMLIGRCEIK